MADRVGTLDETIDRLLSTVPGRGGAPNSSVNGPHALDSSDPAQADFPGKERQDKYEHEAKRLRDYVDVYK
jgi:hypothetical protein